MRSIDCQSGESRYTLEPFHTWTPEKIYERRWALTLLDHTICRLETDYADKGKKRLFEQLKVFLTATTGRPPYEQTATDLDMTVGAVKVALHRLRQRYRELLKEAVAHTVASPDDVQDELNQLLAAIRGETVK